MSVRCVRVAQEKIIKTVKVMELLKSMRMKTDGIVTHVVKVVIFTILSEKWSIATRYQNNMKKPLRFSQMTF